MECEATIWLGVIHALSSTLNKVLFDHHHHYHRCHHHHHQSSPSSLSLLPDFTFLKVGLLCGKTVGNTLRKLGLPICPPLIRGTRKKLTLYQLGSIRMIDINMRMIKMNMTIIIMSWFSNESCERWHWSVERCVHKTGVTPMMSIHGKVLHQYNNQHQ